MSISSLQLDAFYRVAQTLSFNQAAKDLHITQPALSQRIINLENELGVVLFNRMANSIHLTEAGEILRQYCSTKASLEEEAVELLFNRKTEIAGELHVVGFSTFVRSLLLPKAAELMRRYPALNISLSSLEIKHIEHALLSGQAACAFTISPPQNPLFFVVKIGSEKNIMVESAIHKTRSSVYIDHDTFDCTTRDFFLAQDQKPPQFRRIFFDEIYGIIDAVSLGVGRAIVPEHLVKNRDDIREVTGFKPLNVPVYFCSLRKNFSTRLEQFIAEHFTAWRPFENLKFL